jgi:hypothetical protein
VFRERIGPFLAFDGADLQEGYELFILASMAGV